METPDRWWVIRTLILPPLLGVIFVDLLLVAMALGKYLGTP